MHWRLASHTGPRLSHSEIVNAVRLYVRLFPSTVKEVPARFSCHLFGYKASELWTLKSAYLLGG